MTLLQRINSVLEEKKPFGGKQAPPFGKKKKDDAPDAGEDEKEKKEKQPWESLREDEDPDPMDSPAASQAKHEVHLAAWLKQKLMGGATRVVIQTHYGNYVLPTTEFWESDGVIKIAVQGDKISESKNKP